MPNTLAHIGVQGLLHRAILPRCDPRWMLAGCVLPDLSWIVQRLLVSAAPGINPLDLRLYLMIQASLAFCLLPAAALAFCARRPAAAFAVMAGNCLAHLVLDATETKWANGVHLLAPFSWRLTSFGLCWPESTVVSAITALGLVYLLRQWRPMITRLPPLIRPGRRRAAVGLLFLGAYFLLPLLWLGAAEAADNHCVRTLRRVAERPGRAVAFDRCSYDPVTGTVRIFSGETLRVPGLALDAPGRVSLRGRFLDSRTVQVEEYHQHWPLVRDAASLLGLAAVALAVAWPGNRTTSNTRV